MATQIIPLSSAPLSQPMFEQGNVMTVPWSLWFSQLWSYAKGPFLSPATGTMEGVMNTTFFADDPMLVSINLPERFNVGDEFRVVGAGAGGWKITLNGGQTVRRPTGSATVSVASSNRYDGVTLVGIVKDTELSVMYHEGTLAFT